MEKPDMFRFSLLAGAAVALLPQASFARPADSAAQPADASAQPTDARRPLALVSGPTLSEGVQISPVDPPSAPTPQSPGNASGSSQPPLTVQAPPNPDEAIVVTGRRRRTDDVLGDVAVLSGESLAENV